MDVFSRSVCRRHRPIRRPDYSLTKEISMMASLEAKEAARHDAQRTRNRAGMVDFGSWTNAWMAAVSSPSRHYTGGNSSSSIFPTTMMMNMASDSSIYSRNLRRKTGRHSV
uniref:Uncharacterized protein n=1 Tax=Cyclophora tenuis TaxID=216820 RepID=A0A7S1D4Y5_CYCTE|mmetsp:Transcript_20409/g.34822  ORF Transcript_20409/g.34822 Transcript_20409/m.34822 type:complete len:111 (+) Transcript_20409:143-475(+)